MIWLLGGYMWLFIHRPFEVWPWIGEYRVERVYMIVMIVCWAAFANKSWIKNRLNTGVFCLAMAILASNLMSPYSEFMSSEMVQDWFKVLVFYILVVTSIRDERDLRRLVVMFLVATGLYLCHSYREFPLRPTSLFHGHFPVGWCR